MDWFMLQLGRLIVVRLFVERYDCYSSFDFSILEYFNDTLGGRGLFKIELNNYDNHKMLIISMFWFMFKRKWRTK